MSAKLENAEWVETYLHRQLTPFQARCAEIIGLISSGAHNAPVKWEKVEWEWGHKGVAALWNRGCLSTFDFCALTSLVFLCHEARIRLEITPASPQALRLVFFQRAAEGRISARHPNLSEAVADHLAWLPHDSPLIWKNHPEREFEKVAQSFKTPGQIARELAAAAEKHSAPAPAGAGEVMEPARPVSENTDGQPPAV